MFVERTSVGLDVHARSVVASAIDGSTGEVFRSRLTPQHDHVLAWVRELPGPVAVAYEAGPTGFGLYRHLSAAGVRCEVVAPSKITRAAGDRVKTDARDAELLARLLRMGELTSIAVPTVGQEAARDLVRAREDARGDLNRARHRLSKLLLRHGIVYYDGSPWTLRHDAWLRKQRFDQPGTRVAFDTAYRAVADITSRRDQLDSDIAAMAADSEFTPLVRRLACLRGISTLTAFGLAVEIGDWHRFTGASIGAFVGLVPSERSSGQTRTLGPITRAGNGHARRLLIEAAWHQRKHYVVTKTMRARWDLATPAAARRGDAGNRRLRQRWAKFDERGMKPTVANTAIARELAGWCWSLAVMD